MSNKKITVFTPTYNRAYTLHLCYKSLLNQTCNDFLWLIIDDGSNDNTGQLVESWINENKIEIKYIYQENQGMHGAHNTAYENITTELNVCIDSDDYLTNDAIEKILSCWENNFKDNDNIAGIIALDITTDGKVIGTELPKDKKFLSYNNYYEHGGHGDKKLIYRTDVIKKYPKYPLFEGEKYVSLAYLYSLIDLKYKLIILDRPVCVVEYRNDGSSLNMFKQYIKNPRGFAFTRIESMKITKSIKQKFRNSIHYVSSSILLKNKSFLKESPCKIITILSIPFGIALYSFIIYKTRKMEG